MKKNKSKKILKVVTSVAALGIVAAVSIGATMAYLTAKSNVKTNVFTSGGIDVNFDEPEYRKEYEPGKPETEIYKNTYSPGDERAKDPQISIEKSSQDTYVAMTLEFYAKTTATAENVKNGIYKDTTGGVVTYWEKLSMDDFAQYADLEYYNSDSLEIGINPKWVEAEADVDTNEFKTDASVDDTAYYDKVYGYYFTDGAGNLVKLTNATGDGNVSKTVPIFDMIKFKTDGDVMNAQLSGSVEVSNSVPDVKIVATAYAVRANSYANDDEAKDALNNLIGDNAASVRLNNTKELKGTTKA